ncbi:MAG: formimidoylglutamate deiminase [Gammaproteobacteria bacterium]|nr:MAG: formimidoylglutamate deiminase [Gammaproteobacteria bacterium]
MHKLYAENILIGSDWQTEVTLTIDYGIIKQINKGREEGAIALNGAVIPGMSNCHSHAFQRAFAGFSEYRGNSEDSFWSWRDIMYKFVAKMTPEDAHIVAKFVYIEMLKAGYTSVGEFHYLHHQADGTMYDDPAEMSHQVIQAAFDVGISITHLPVLYTYAGFGEKKPSKEQARFIHSTQDYLDLVNQLEKSYSNRSNFQLGIAPHSLRAVSKEQLKDIVPFIRQTNPKAPIHIHIAEQLKEVDDCLSFYKERPVEWLLNNFQMDEHWCLIHATHLTEEEIKNTAESGAVVGICPLTEANLGDGIFPTVEFSKLGGKFAIGSDSHIGINVAEELRLLEYAQRLTSHQRAVLVDENCPSVGQTLYTKTCKDGAISLNQNAGKIATGKNADFLVLDDNEPSLFSKKESFILDASIFACNQLPVKDVYVAGEKVIENGQHRLQEKAKNQYREVLKKLA